MTDALRPPPRGTRPRRRHRVPRRRWTGATAAAVAVLVAGTAGLAPAAAASDSVPAPEPVAAVDEFLRERLAATSIPGAALALTRGDDVLLVRGYGHGSDHEPVTADTRFRIASLSKSFTSLAVLQLQDAGRLTLDDPVVAHLPELRLADPRGVRITVRQLLDHTSGLADRSFPDLDRTQPASPAQAVASMSSAHLVAAPGTQFNYHNPNYHVAARLVEVVSGQTFAHYLRDHVFLPAGMDSTTTTVTAAEPVDGLPDGHVVAYGQAIAAPGVDAFEVGAGNVVSTAADMADWLVVHANGGRAANGTRLVSEGALAEMHTGRTADGYALGWGTRGRAQAPTRVEHTGNLLSYSAFQAVLRDSGYGVALLFNSGSAYLQEQAALFDGVVDIVDGGGVAAHDARSTATRDALLAALTLAVLLLGTHGVAVSRRWADRHGSSAAQVALRLLPLSGVVVVVAAFPRVAQRLAYGGRDVDWQAAAYGWPALVVLVGATLVAAAATLAARVVQLGRRSRSSRVTSPRPLDPHRAAASARPGTSRPSW